MAYSYFQYTGNGTTKIFSTPLYLDQGHIHVYVNGVETTAFTWVTSSTISITTAPASGAVVIVKRITPLDSQLVDFTSGSLLNEETMDLMATFNLYVAQEVEDKTELVLAVDENNLVDSHNKRIINLADAVDDTDAMNKQSVVALTATSVAQAEAARDSAVSARDSAILNATSAAEDAAAADSAKEDAEAAAASVVGMEADLDALQTDGVLDVVTAGGFWADDAARQSRADGKIHRLEDRLFVGNTDFTGNWAISEVGEDEAIDGGIRWIPREATFLTVSPNGRIAVAAMTETKDQEDINPGPDGSGLWATIAVAGVGVANGTLPGAVAWGGYFEAYTAVANRAAFGIEIDIGNMASTEGINNPYQPFASTGGEYGLNIAAGGSAKYNLNTPEYLHPSTCAIIICNNDSTFHKGIVFDAEAIEGTNGVTGSGTAICMAKGHDIIWQSAANVNTGRIRCIGTSATNFTGIQLQDNAMVIQNGNGGTVFSSANTSNSAVNFVRAFNSITGSAPGIQAAGTDGSVDLWLLGAGTTGRVKFGTWVSGTGTVNGYIIIKDNSGTERKLATIA